MAVDPIQFAGPRNEEAETDTMYGIGLTPLGTQSYMIETQLFWRRSMREAGPGHAVCSALGLNATPVSQCYPSPWKLS